jgi:hypothetical protein
MCSRKPGVSASSSRLRQYFGPASSRPEGAEFEVRDAIGFTDFDLFIEEWLEITDDPNDSLRSHDMWEAYVRYRVLAHHPNPRAGGNGWLTKSMLTLLWAAGWKGIIDEQRRYKDPSANTERRMPTYTKLKLSDFALSKLADIEAARAKREQAGVSEEEQTRLWDRT